MNRKTLLDMLNCYTPYNVEEEKDLQLIKDFIINNPNCYSRDNIIAHVTVSSWIVNQNKTKVLMIYHNIYNSWSWTGGHADNDEDLLNVSIKEAKEETGLENIKVLSNDIFSLEVLTVDGHYKKNKYVNSHLHLNITYLLEANDNDYIKPKLDENKAVKWIEIDNVKKEVREEWMMNHIYQKLSDKVKNL